MKKQLLLLSLLILAIGSTEAAIRSSNGNARTMRAIKNQPMPVQAAVEPAMTIEQQHMVYPINIRKQQFTEAKKAQIKQAVIEKLHQIVEQYNQNLQLNAKGNRLAAFYDADGNLITINEIPTKPVHLDCDTRIPHYQQALKNAFHNLKNQFGDKLQLQKIGGKAPANVLGWYEEATAGLIGAPKWYLYLSNNMNPTIEELQMHETTTVKQPVNPQPVQQPTQKDVVKKPIRK